MTSRCVFEWDHTYRKADGWRHDVSRKDQEWRHAFASLWKPTSLAMMVGSNDSASLFRNLKIINRTKLPQLGKQNPKLHFLITLRTLWSMLAEFGVWLWVKGTKPERQHMLLPQKLRELSQRWRHHSDRCPHHHFRHQELNIRDTHSILKYTCNTLELCHWLKCLFTNTTHFRLNGTWMFLHPLFRFGMTQHWCVILPAQRHRREKPSAGGYC